VTTALETEMKQRLGKLAFNGGREIRYLASLVEPQPLRAIVIAAVDRRSWGVAATDDALHLHRHPRVFGRKGTRQFRWSALTAKSTDAMGLDLDFGAERIRLFGPAPAREATALTELARRALAVPGEESPIDLAGLHELARSKLGRALAYGQSLVLDALPDRLLPGERVERLAYASTDFDGLLVLTDRRLLLFDMGLRRGSERLWSLDRADIEGVTLEPNGIRLDSPTGSVLVGDFSPVERRDEFAAVLGA